MKRCITHQCNHECQCHHCRPFKQIVGQAGAGQCHRNHKQQGDCCCHGGHLAHHRTHTVTQCPTVGDRAADFLFEWQKESGYECKHHKPQRHDWFEAVLAECFLAQPEKHIDGDATHQEARADGEAARGQSRAHYLRRWRRERARPSAVSGGSVQKHEASRGYSPRLATKRCADYAISEVETFLRRSRMLRTLSPASSSTRWAVSCASVRTRGATSLMRLRN